MKQKPSLDVDATIAQLKKKYPGKIIICDPEDQPTEIICEIEPTVDHPEYSIAIAVFGFSKPHVHNQITERYEVIQGTLCVYLNGIAQTFSAGSDVTIHPGTVHWISGQDTWIIVHSTPGWTFEDHILVDEDQ